MILLSEDMDDNCGALYATRERTLTSPNVDKLPVFNLMKAVLYQYVYICVIYIL